MKSRVTLNIIPKRFLDWMVTSRVKFLTDMREGKPTRYFSAHLPVMATWRNGDPFPVNMTVKGIGLIPREAVLHDYIDIFESVLADARTLPWHESLGKRLGAVTKLYSNPENFDPCMLGGLEIFEGSAFANLRENPRASLLYVGMSQTAGRMEYISFQINGNVEILQKDNSYYRYLLASRKLFEFDSFHIYQPDYPFGYLIRVSEVKDKSPWSRAQKEE